MKVNNTFILHSKAKYWSNKNKNKPSEISMYSHKKFWFDCDICGHEFEGQISSISKGSWCPYCSIPCQKLCSNENCQFCFEKSFASNEKYKYWSNKNDVSPRYVHKGSHKTYVFNCIDCNHEISMIIHNITINNCWCPYCSIPCQKLCSNENCQFCFENSFISHQTSKYWSNKNDISPRYVHKGSENKYIFNCIDCNNEFKNSPYRVGIGYWCPNCKHKTEKKLLLILQKEYNVKTQVKYEWCKNNITNRYLPFDFEIDSNIIIELDGNQHFKQILNWKPPEIQRDNDKYKMKCALQNKKHIIRILQNDVYYDKNDWYNKLINTIKELLEITIPSIRYIGIDIKYYT